MGMLPQDVTSEDAQRLFNYTPMVTCCAFSLDGQLLATSHADGKAKVWKVATGRAHLTLQCHAAMARACAFSPNGRMLVTVGDDGMARLWDADWYRSDDVPRKLRLGTELRM
jgi:WD40 repeat protein